MAKKRSGINCQFDLRPLEVENHLVCKWHATYCSKAFDEGYNFALDLTSIGSFHTKLWASKVAKVPILKILGLHLGVLRQNDIWVLVLGKAQNIL
jgi:uncharacterized membrane protein